MNKEEIRIKYDYLFCRKVEGVPDDQLESLVMAVSIVDSPNTYTLRAPTICTYEKHLSKMLTDPAILSTEFALYVFALYTCSYAWDSIIAEAIQRAKQPIEEIDVKNWDSVVDNIEWSYDGEDYTLTATLSGETRSMFLLGTSLGAVTSFFRSWFVEVYENTPIE